MTIIEFLAVAFHPRRQAAGQFLGNGVYPPRLFKPSDRKASAARAVAMFFIVSLFSIIFVSPASAVPPPTMTSVAPTSGSVAGGNTVVITGANFSGITNVYFSGALATILSNTGTELTVTAPAYPVAQMAEIHVFQGGAVRTIFPNAYRYIAVPVANPVSVTVAPNSGANAVALNVTSGPAESVSVATPPAHGSATASGATISYQPDAGFSGQDSFTYTATNVLGTSSPSTTTVTVTRPYLPFTPASGSPLAATQGSPYSRSITVSGGTAPYTFALGGSALPAGLNLDPTGAITGTPSETGNFSVIVTVTDAFGATGTGGYPLTVSAAAAAAPPVVNDAPGSTVDSTSTASAKSVDINLASLVTGAFNDIRIETPPQHGTVQLNAGSSGATAIAAKTSFKVAAASAPQFVATYTPEPGYQGPDSFTFVAIGPGGTSAPASVAITVIANSPLAQALTATTAAGQSVTLDITSGALAGPFIGAAIVSIAPADSATAQLIEGGVANNRTYQLQITPSGQFEGTAVISYSLTNGFGTSAPAAITLTVETRSDPSQDPMVRGIVVAQADTTRRFATTQIGNFSRRTEQLHGSGAGSLHRQVGIQLTDGNAMHDPEVSNDSQSAVGYREVTNASDAETMQLGNDSASASNAMRSVGSLGLWTGGAIQIGTRERTSRTSELGVSSSGLSAGLDMKLNDRLTLGLGGGYGSERTEVGEDDSDQAIVDGDSWTGALYGSFAPVKDVFIDGVIGAGRVSFDTRRMAESDVTANGSRDGSLLFGSLAGGIDRYSGSVNYSGYGRLEYLSSTLDAYAESGANLYNLAFGRRELKSFSSVLGARGSINMPSSLGLFTPRLRLEWRHEFNGSGVQALDYSDQASFAYTIQGDDWMSDEFSLELGTGLRLDSGWTLSIDLGGQLSSDSTAGTARATVSTQF